MTTAGTDHHIEDVGDPMSAVGGYKLRTLKSRSLIVDLFPAFIQDLGGWIAISDLVELMGTLGYEPQSVRSTVSRFMKKGLLERRTVESRVGYHLSAAAAHNIEVNQRRVFDTLERARPEDGWVLCTFSVPETLRTARYQLRTALDWLGFGNLNDGLWLAPARTHAQLRQTVAWLGLASHADLFVAHYRDFGDPRSLVARSWDLDELREEHSAFLAEFEPIAARYDDGTDPDPSDSFVDFVRVVAAWRRLSYDPGIPLDLLPDEWEGERSRRLFATLKARLEPPARRYVVSVVGRGS